MVTKRLMYHFCMVFLKRGNDRQCIKSSSVYIYVLFCLVIVTKFRLNHNIYGILSFIEQWFYWSLISKLSGMTLKSSFSWESMRDIELIILWDYNFPNQGVSISPKSKTCSFALLVSKQNLKLLPLVTTNSIP